MTSKQLPHHKSHPSMMTSRKLRCGAPLSPLPLLVTLVYPKITCGWGRGGKGVMVAAQPPPLPAHHPASSIIFNTDLATSVPFCSISCRVKWVKVSSTPRCQSYYAKNLSLVMPLPGSSLLSWRHTCPQSPCYLLV